MGKYKCLKITYSQHLSIKGWGLSVNVPADSLIALEGKVKSASASNPMLKAFYNRVLPSSMEGLAEAQKEYNEFKKTVKTTKKSLEKAKLVTELGKRRKAFAKKISDVYDAVNDKASRFQGEIRNILGKMEEYRTEKYKDESERFLKFKKLRVDKSKFFDDELEIHNVDDLTDTEMKERLQSMEQLMLEFLLGNAGTIKKIQKDLTYIMNRKIKVEELSAENFDKLEFSPPSIKQGIKLDERGKVIKEQTS